MRRLLSVCVFPSSSDRAAGLNFGAVDPQRDPFCLGEGEYVLQCAKAHPKTVRDCEPA